MGWGGGRSRASSHIYQRCVRKERERERGAGREREGVEVSSIFTKIKRGVRKANLNKINVSAKPTKEENK